MTTRLLPHDRYVLALKRIRALIADGKVLDYEDSNTIGNKYNYCTWGLCSIDRATWPDAEDHMRPAEFIAHGRIAPRYLGDDQPCPLYDKALAQTRFGHSRNGCFWTCRIFEPGHKERPTREETLRLYDEQIAQAKKGVDKR
jgi:hypothetical protein